MKSYYTIKTLSLFILLAGLLNINVSGQICEWRLTNPTFANVDPDGAGPALGSSTFTLQIRTTAGTIPQVTAMSTGFSYQSTTAMVPTNPGCAIMSAPPNVTVAPEFAGAGFTYTVVNQCGTVGFAAGGQNFDRRAVGTFDCSGAGVTLTTDWKDVFTVTLWTLSASNPQGGYVIINSGEGGSPGEFGTYAVSDFPGNGYPVNSATYNTPLMLSGTLPVLFSQFEAKCSNNGTAISWSTEQESNSAYFELERSINGTTWKTLGRTPAAGNSTSTRKYNQLDLEAGNAMYRVKQVDRDGQVIYTNIERANCQVKNISAVIYPVPAKDVLNVVIKSDKAVRTQLMVFEISGKLVRKLDANVQNGTNNFSIDLKGLTSGDYILKSSDAGVELNKQFTVIR